MRKATIFTIVMLLVMMVTVPAAAAKPLTVLTFDELPYQPVNGLTYRGVTFSFEIDGEPSTDAHYNSDGPGQITYVQDPSLEGNAEGILALEFLKPTTVVEFGVALSVLGTLDPGVVVDLYRPGRAGRLRETVPLVTSSTGFTEGLFTYKGPAVKTAVISFNSDVANRFALDNLSYHQGEGTDPTIRLETSPTSGDIGDLFTTQVFADNIPSPGLGSWQATIEYDPSILAVESVEFGTDLASTGRNVGNLGPSSGMGSVTLGQFSYGTQDGPTGSDLHLATIVWRGIANGVSDLDLNSSVLLDINTVEFTPLVEIDNQVTVNDGSP